MREMQNDIFMFKLTQLTNKNKNYNAKFCSKF